jgi:hypothetical protein
MNRNLAAVYVLGLFVLAGRAGPDDNAPALKPANLDSLNTTREEDDPHLGSNGLVIYFSSNAAAKFDILMATRPSPDQPWGAGKALEDYIQTRVDDRSVFATPEGRYPQFLYFATRKDTKVNNFDIYVAVKLRAGGAFTSPTPLNTVCTEVDELHPWLSADGRELYFSRHSVTGWRVHAASRAGNTGAAGFGEPVRLKELPPNFHHATLTPDGKTMYLQGPLEKGRWGLFRSTRGTNGWSAPVALDELNHPDAPTGDRSPCLSSDGTLLYFASDRPGGKGGLDLWAIRTDLLRKR